MKLINFLSISGSPVENSSTDILLRAIGEGFVSSYADASEVLVNSVKTNELKAIPCQACGKAPTPEYCFYEDDLTSLYLQLIECDCLVFGSPIYFDTVSAQAKLLIDRCNCLRPVDFDSKTEKPQFVNLIKKERPGAIVLVGGEDGYFEGARRTIAGFFKWINVTNYGTISFSTSDFRKTSQAEHNKVALCEAFEIGQLLASQVPDNG